MEPTYFALKMPKRAQSYKRVRDPHYRVKNRKNQIANRYDRAIRAEEDK